MEQTISKSWIAIRTHIHIHTHFDGGNENNKWTWFYYYYHYYYCYWKLECTLYMYTNKQTLTRIHRLKQNKFIDSIPNLNISERTSTKPVQHFCKTRDKINNNNTHNCYFLSWKIRFSYHFNENNRKLNARDFYVLSAELCSSNSHTHSYKPQ